MTQLLPNQEFNHLATNDQIVRTARALEANGMHTIVLENAEQALGCVLEMIPPGALIHNPPSRTLEQIGLANELTGSANFHDTRSRLHEMDRQTQQREIRQLTSSPDVLLGSVHAITEEGQVMMASASGSQMAAAVFGAGKVIWVVGTQKLVPDLEEGHRRIREYSYPLEEARAREAYGQPSAINKLLIVNKEKPGRITIVLVKQNLGF